MPELKLITIQSPNSEFIPASIILLAALAAEEYYARLGMTQHCSAWILQSDQVL